MLDDNQHKFAMIVLFGGNGFIGRHVCDLLVKERRSGIVVTRRPLKVEERLFDLNYLSLDEWREASSIGGLSHVSAFVYLASKSVPGTFVAEPWEELIHNVNPAMRSFDEIFKINSKAKIILLSSGGVVYGRITKSSVEEDEPTNPISSYGLGKLMVEEALKFNARSTGQPFNIFRVSNPIGIHQSSKTQGIVPIAMRAIRDNKPLSIFGDGSNIRDYIDADDVAQAILAACDDRSHNSQTWNLGSGTGRTILEILSIVEEVSKKKLQLDFKPARPTDVPSIVLNSGRLRTALGWSPSISIEESCRKVWSLISIEG